MWRRKCTDLKLGRFFADFYGHRLFLRGVADGSFGVEVAKLAQLPGQVVARAEQILMALSDAERRQSPAAAISSSSDRLVNEYERLMRERDALRIELARTQAQLRSQEAVCAALASVDYNELSPKKAFDLLWQFKKD